MFLLKQRFAASFVAIFGTALAGKYRKQILKRGGAMNPWNGDDGSVACAPQMQPPETNAYDRYFQWPHFSDEVELEFARVRSEQYRDGKALCLDFLEPCSQSSGS